MLFHAGMCFSFLWSRTVQAVLWKWRHCYLGKQSTTHLIFHFFCQPNTNVLWLHTDCSPSSLLSVLSLIIDWPAAILGSWCYFKCAWPPVAFCLYWCTHTLTTVVHPTKIAWLCCSYCWMVTNWTFWRQEAVICTHEPQTLWCTPVANTVCTTVLCCALHPFWKIGHKRFCLLWLKTLVDMKVPVIWWK